MRSGGSVPNPLKTLTSLNKEVWPSFLSDNSIGVFPLFLPLSDYSIWRSYRIFEPCDHSIWSIWVHSPQILLDRLGKMDKRSLDPLI